MRRMRVVVNLVRHLPFVAAVGLIVPSLVEASGPRWETGRVVDVIPLVFAWTYEIETSTGIVVATKYKAPCRITLETPLRVAIDGDHVRLVDEAGREHKLKVDFRRPKADPAATKAALTKAAGHEPTPSLPKGGEILKGMSAADVESALGKAKKVGEARGAITWTYDDVVVYLREDRVEALVLTQR